MTLRVVCRVRATHMLVALGSLGGPVPHKHEWKPGFNHPLVHGAPLKWTSKEFLWGPRRAPLSLIHPH